MPLTNLTAIKAVGLELFVLLYNFVFIPILNCLPKPKDPIMSDDAVQKVVISPFIMSKS